MQCLDPMPHRRSSMLGWAWSRSSPTPGRSKRLPDPSLLRHVSPLGWDHIVLTGDYDWNSGAAERTNVRPLNIHPAKIRAWFPVKNASLT